MRVLSKVEQETIIRWDASDREDVLIFTADPVVMRKLDKLVFDHPEHYQLLNERDQCKEYKTSSKYIRFGKPPSAAKRSAAAKNFANIP